MANPLANSALPGALEIAFNRFLRMNPQAEAEFAELQGKRIAFKLSDLGLAMTFVPQASGLQVFAEGDETADAAVLASSMDFIKIALATDKREAALSSGMRFAGDTELAQRFQQIMEGIDFDWEEQLSRLTGDVIAHQIGGGLRRLFSFGQQAATRGASQAAASLSKDEGEIISRQDFSGFSQEIDELRDATARLEARFARLQQAKAGDEA